MWGALIIPVITIAILYWHFHKHIAWWEVLVLFGACVICIAIIYGITMSALTWDTEYMADHAVKVEYHEKYTTEWEEYVPDQTDKDGNVTVPGHWVTHTDYHPEHWDLVTSRSGDFRISKKEYNRVTAYWDGDPVYKDLYHADQRNGFLDGRGDMFYLPWPRSHKTIEYATWTASYENRVQAADSSIFQFPDVDEERTKELYQYPDKSNIAILGKPHTQWSEANKELMRWNAKNGPRPDNNFEKACRVWFVLFDGSNLQDGLDQESLWDGGNKNEFVVCIGLDKEGKVNWRYVFAWSKSDKLKIDVRDSIKLGEKLDLFATATHVGEECNKRFERRHFEEFSYLTVSPPLWSVIFCYIFTLCVSVGVGVFVVKNEYTLDNWKV